ncbi:MAG: Crp/Fnr family transcriptional regulator [Actinomycetota bacterium]
MSAPELDRLRRVPLFADLDEEGLRSLADIATEFDAAHGHVLMYKGQAGSGMFIIEEGSVRVEIPSGDPVALGPGEFVGELSVLADAPRMARVCVEEPLRALAISRNDLNALLEREPSIAVAMLRSLARRFAGVEVGGSA